MSGPDPFLAFHYGEVEVPCGGGTKTENDGARVVSTDSRRGSARGEGGYRGEVGGREGVRGVQLQVHASSRKKDRQQRAQDGSLGKRKAGVPCRSPNKRTCVDVSPSVVSLGKRQCVGASPGESALENKLEELKLIKDFRKGRRASVDAFHDFLVNLPAGTTGNFWALVASLLSVQCRDVVALKCCKSLMKKCPAGMPDIANLGLEELQRCIRSCNFYKTKAGNIMAAIATLESDFHGRVPSSYAELLKLKGVGPKVAHLLRSISFGIEDTGIVVDTHVHRVSKELAWVSVDSKSPEATRKQLQLWVPRTEWVEFTTAIVGFGQFTQRLANWKSELLRFAQQAGMVGAAARILGAMSKERKTEVIVLD